MMSDNQMCNDAQEQFDIHELGLAPLDPVARRQMEQHFESCEPCRTWLSNWELIKLDTRELRQLEVPLTVLSSIMSEIDVAAAPVSTLNSIQDYAPGAAPPAVQAAPASNSTAPLFKSDAVIAGIALCALLLAGGHYAAEGFEGTAAWCCSFIVLFVGHHFLQSKGQEPIYKT